jgi:small-conductance mechanosensitive channel
MTFLDLTFYGNAVRVWAVAMLVAGLAVGALYLFKSIILRRAILLATKTATDIDDFVLELLRRTKTFFFLTLAIYIGSLVLTLPADVTRLLNKIVIIVLFVQVAIWGSGLITQWVTRYRRQQVDQEPGEVTTIVALSFVGQLVLWSIMLLLVLDNLGVQITALVTGLGIGGIAVGLAVQNILGDLFASLSLVLDKPFVIGDFIIVDDLMGTVERVGLKTTRLRSLSGELLVFGNNDLLQSRIRNYKRMYERRVVFSFGVIYQTPHEKLAAIPAIVQEIIEGQDQIRFDRAHFYKFGDSSLDFEVVYYVLDPDYNIFMDIHQAINLEIFRRFADKGIEFAYPTQTLYLDGQMTSIVEENLTTTQPPRN